MSNINFTSMVKYLNASPSRAGTVANQIAAQVGKPYFLPGDYWKTMREALVADRRLTRDGQALAAAAQNTSDPKKKPLFTTTARNWAELAPRWDGHTHVHLPATTVLLGDLPVRIPALCAEQLPNGELEVLLVRFNLEELNPDAIQGALRILQRAYPGATVTFVDVQRKKVTTAGPRLKKYDGWLDQAGMYIAHVLRQQGGQAA